MEHQYMAVQNIKERERVVEQKEKVVHQLFANAERMKAELEAASMSLARREEELNMARECLERDRSVLETLQAHHHDVPDSSEEVAMLEMQLGVERERGRGYERAMAEIEDLGRELRETSEKAGVLEHRCEAYKSEATFAMQEAEGYRKKFDEEKITAAKLMRQLEDISTEVGRLQGAAGGEIERLGGKLEEEIAAKEQALGLIAEQEISLRELGGEHASMKVQVKALQDATTRIRTAHSRQQQTLDDIVAEMSNLVQTIKSQQSDIHARGRAIRDKDTALQQRDSELRHLHSFIDSFKQSRPSTPVIVPPPYVPLPAQDRF